LVDDDDDGGSIGENSCFVDTVFQIENYAFLVEANVVYNSCNIDGGLIFVSPAFLPFSPGDSLNLAYYYNDQLTVDSVLTAGSAFILFDAPVGEYIFSYTSEAGCTVIDTTFVEDCNQVCADSTNYSNNLQEGVYYADDIITCSALIDGNVSLLAGRKNDFSEFIELQIGFEALGNFLFEAVNVDCDSSDN